ncbi:FAD-dependent oxidoreductase [Pontiella desulfatans]|uniref:FAD-dependent oxidoreductase n=1 Tax=Pontiella desulfatans TaxID=2750659 RepID=UPI0014448515|nr:FAD-dependent oxidoreductase [Pontiella desulfatans]
MNIKLNVSQLKIGFLSIFATLAFQVGASAEGVIETAKEIPLAYDVDVVVAGGSVAGVEAACAAADSGASVLVVESRPYLGYDLCASQKLWLNPEEQPLTKITKELFKASRQITPLQVKSLLDRSLLTRKVKFMTGSFPAELLVDEQGVPSGLTMMNRSGRQAIRAKVIIDATENAILTRQTAAKFAPFKPGKKTFKYTVIGGDLKETGTKVPSLTFKSSITKGRGKNRKTEKKTHSVYEYSFPLEYNADTFRERSRVLNEVRSKVYDPNMVDHSEKLRYTPDNVVAGGVRPKGVDHLYVLNAYSGEQKSLLGFARVGEEVGREAAKKAKARVVPASLQYAHTSDAKPSLAVTEVEPSFRFRNSPQLKLGNHELPVLGRWDVVVVGGGTSGAPAALGATRSGAKTLAIEYMDELGGVGTAGLISRYWFGFRFGYTAEIDKALGTKEEWSQIQKSEWLRSQLIQSGGEVWFTSFGCGTVMDGNKVTGVVVATPFGRGVVLADVVIDSTGNSDIAAAAHAQTHYSISKYGDLSVQISNNPPRKLGAGTTNPARYMLHDNDVFDRWHLKLSGRKTGGKVHDMAQLIPSRDRRRSICDYTLTTEDILTKRTFPDTISHHKSNFDAGAHPDTEMFLVKDMKGPVFTCDMPYRCLTPKGLEGVLVTGLGASTTRDAMTLTRMQPDLQNQGYAVGMAAAMAVDRTRGLVREINLKELQQALVENGCLEERVLADVDSFPLSQEAIRQAVKQLNALTIGVHQKPEHDDTHRALAVVMSHPQQSIPLLKQAYAKASNPDIKLNFARVLAILDDATGKDTLIAAVRNAPDWGNGWDYSNQRKYANTFGEVDRMVIATGFLQTPDVVEPLLGKLDQLTMESPLSHYKAICLALRMNKNASMAKPVADFLNNKGLTGHAQVLDYYDGKNTPARNPLSPKGGKELNRKFKEVLVAALLYECGDYQDVGRNILEAYTKDVNGHFAEYAHHVLTHGTAMSDSK